MKLVFKIAKAELRNLFYSPIAWFLTIAFMVQCAITYTNLIDQFAASQEMGGMELEELTKLTAKVFTHPYYGLFNSIMQNLYLYIPLLTMGLISREINGGTISLLYSSPVKIRQIVFGKYLAMMIYSFILLLVISIFMVAGVFDIQSADYGVLLSAALGFYLLLCAYSAIGLFMSSLTSYQIVAAVSTFVVIGILTYIGNLWQGIDFVRDLTYFLSLSGRTRHMLIGLITSADVIYFVVIIFIFLGFVIYKLQAGRETKPWFINAGRYAGIIIISLIVGYISSRPAFIGYLDTTANQDNTLTPNTQKIMKELGNDKLEITAYTNYLDDYYWYGIPDQRNSYLANWERYLRFKPNINFRYVNYYDTPYAVTYNFFASYKGKTLKQIAEPRAKSSDINMSKLEAPAQMQKQNDLKPELNRFVMKLTYKGKSTYLRVFDDMWIWPFEAEVSAAFKRLLQADIPKIIFVTGEGERRTGKKGDREYRTVTSDKTFRYSLINQGFDVDSISLNTQNIPNNIAALVLADPQYDLSAAAVEKIEAFIAKGGNLLITGEPGRQQILNPLLKNLGVQLSNGMLAEESEDYAPMLLLPGLTKTATGFTKMLSKPSIDTLPVSMNGVSALSFHDTSGFHVQPLITSKAADAVKNTMRRNPDLDLANTKENDDATKHAQVQTIGGDSLVNNGATTKKLVDLKPANVSNGIYTTAVALTRQINGKQQRIVISGDADFLSNSESGRYSPKVANFYFSTAIFSWLDYGNFPIDASRPDEKDNRVTVSTDHMSLLRIFYIYLIPGVIAIFATIFLIRRKRK